MWLAAAFSLWAICFALSLGSVLRGDAISPLLIRAPEESSGHPTLLAYRPWFERPAAGPEIGSPLVAVGPFDLSGVGPLGLWVRVAAAAGDTGRVKLEFLDNGRSEIAEIPVGSLRVVWPYLVISLSFVLTAAVLVAGGARNSRPNRALVAVLLVAAINLVSNFGNSQATAALSIAVHLASMTLLFPLSIHAMMRFPEIDEPPHPALQYGAWGFALIGLFESMQYYGAPWSSPAGTYGFFGLQSAGCVLILAVTTRNLRRSDPIRRRQLKWMLLGWYGAIVPVGAAATAAAFDPRLIPLYVASQLALVLIPISLWIAIQRYNWFDVDRVLSTAASLSAVAVAAVGIMVFVAPQVADGASDLIGVDPSQGQLVAALATAIAAALAHRRLRPRVERSINPGRATLDLGIVSLLDELEGCVDLADLMQVIGLRLHDLLAAEAIVIYGRVDGAYAPFYVEGRAVPPAFEATSPLIAALSERDGALTLAVLGRVPEDVGLSPFDRAALETLDAAVILPLQTEEMLVAFLCLGARGNGDVYTHLDVRRLEQLSDRVRQKLAGFGADNVRREGHALQEALRSYVPGVVADAIATGRDVTPGECEVSVLFVDLAGYTRYSESLPASEIFTTINRYTRAVSEIVANHGGTVVEFCGDGLMAVFGAPTPLKGKEREAVAAALEMVSNVAALGLEQPRGRGSDPTPLTLGVGIATGEVYVGNLKAIDRLIWSAIGNTTILAARLQVLTHDLRASIVVDPTTWERATAEVQAFTRRERTPIRGRTDPVDVYALSTAQAGPPVPNPGT